jgi:hypothetical protein
MRRSEKLPSRENDNITPFPKSVEVKLADVLFFAMKKNLMLFKDLGNEQVHYSVFIRGSLIDFHKTLEDQHRHIQLAEIEFDWQFLMGRIVQGVWTNWRSIFQAVKTDDPARALSHVPIKITADVASLKVGTSITTSILYFILAIGSSYFYQVG